MSGVMMAPAGMSVGTRVVRGPDWKWATQDDGEGHVGTVIEIGRPGSKTSPDKTVVVQWDSGNKTNYRVGYQGAYDLRIYDNAPAGVKHPSVICDGCSEQGIAGIRWSCSKCKDFDLCSACYSAGKHDNTHVFLRQITANCKPTKVGKRQGCTVLEAKGIFPGAKVERGPAWEWGNQDGGDGKQGKVLDIRGWDTETERSVANIIWQSGTANVYRLGHKGKADLKYRVATCGGQYYRDHLPLLGQLTEQIHAPPPCPFKIGNKVKVDMDADTLRQMQEGHGGWNPKMAEYVHKVGTVHRITDKGDIRVQYDGCSNRWTFHPGALTKVLVYNVGDAVMVIRDIEKVKELQKGHGEWTECMSAVLGMVGKVAKVYSDGDMRVCINSQTWTFNPLCCVPRPQDQAQMDNTKTVDENPGCTKLSLTSNAPGGAQSTSMLEQIMRGEDDSVTSDSLVKEAAQGHTDVVREIISKHPEQVNVKSAGKTALQVASHQGGFDMVKLLLKTNADVELKDNDGDTALHYSAFGNQPDIMKLLLESGSNVNAVNEGGCSTLHVAVNKQHLDCVKVLIEHACDVNIQDTYGDTAQHDAIGKESTEIVRMLMDHADVDFSLKNKRGFNALHHAALKGNAYATEKILARAPMMVDLKKDDGFSALHLASLNGHSSVVQVLLKEGRADIEVKNNRQQTALMLACTQGHQAVVEMLVNSGASVSAEDEEGHTPLHLVFLRLQGDSQTSNPGKADQTSVTAMMEETAAIAKFLAESNADVLQNDVKGRTPLDLVTDPDLKTELSKYRVNASTALCIVCDEQDASVVFQPCRHRIACTECCVKMKKCLKCGELIEKKVLDGSELDASFIANQPAETVKDLNKKMREIEDTLTCVICLDRKKNMAFLCGHSACNECAQPLRQCHMCRKPITKRINLFN
ncbi:E3 ubiquitin-protein ligase MIB2-like [Watersipora subatra]|uniref:E3 ubiquitin-protein ligase MIB2-like n=1 Tax=Watersipora subatra TaxID=2589382 RepID=UPI00355C1DCD